MSGQQNLNGPWVAIQTVIEVVGDVLDGRPGLQVLGQHFLGNFGELGLLRRPEIRVAMMIEDVVARLARFEIAAQFGQNEGQKALFQIAQVLGFLPPLGDHPAEMVPAILIAEAEPSRFMFDPIE